MGNFRELFKNADKVLLILAVAFAAVSLIMLESISYDGSLVLSRDVVVQGVAYVLGFVLLFLILLIDYRVFQNFRKILYILSLAILLSVYIPGLGYEQFGSRAWIHISTMTFQPSEIVKITFTLLMAGYFTRHRSELDSFKSIILAALYAAPFILIIVKEDMGSALVFCAIWVFMLFYAGIDYRAFIKFIAVFLLSLPIVYKFMASYQKERIDAFLHPDNLSLQGNWQVYQSKIAIGSGGFTGKGLFNGTQKELDYLPVQKSDFMFSVIVEETGFIGGAVILCMFALFFYRIARIIYDARDLYGALVAIGFIGMFLFQVFENIAMAMGIMPVTGVTLPFISYGGSSVLANLIALGFIISVGMRSKVINF